MQRIQQYWQAQTAAEYASAAITAEFAHWLLQLGAPPDLVRQCLGICEDEIAHAEHCYQVFVAAGGTGQGIDLQQQSLQLESPHSDPRKNLVMNLLNFYCLGETAAVPLFAAMRKPTQQAEAIAAYERILQDEPRHANFGWLSLAWADEAWPETKQWLQELLPDALQRKRQQYGQGNEYDPPLSLVEQQWGILPQRQYQQILETTILALYAKHLKYYALDVQAV